MLTFPSTNGLGFLGCFGGGSGRTLSLTFLSLGLCFPAFCIPDFGNSSSFFFLLRPELSLGGIPFSDCSLSLGLFLLKPGQNTSLVFGIGEKGFSTGSGEEIQSHLGGLGPGVSPTLTGGFAEEGAVGEHGGGPVPAILKNRHLQGKPTSIGLADNLIGLGKNVAVPFPMGEKVLHVIGQDILRNEPASKIFGKGGDITEDGIDEDMLMAGDVEVLTGPYELTQFPVIIHPFQSLLPEEITEDMLQPGSIAGEIPIENFCHLPFEDEHTGEDIAAVPFTLGLIKGAVGKD